MVRGFFRRRAFETCSSPERCSNRSQLFVSRHGITASTLGRADTNSRRDWRMLLTGHYTQNPPLGSQMSVMGIFQQPRHSCEYCAESQLTPQGNGGTMGSKTLIAVGLIWLVVVALWLWLSPQQWGHIWLAKGTTKRTARI